MAIIGQGKTRGQTALLGIDACTNQNVAAFVFNEELVIPEYVWLWAQSKYESHRQGGHTAVPNQLLMVKRLEALHFLCLQLTSKCVLLQK